MIFRCYEAPGTTGDPWAFKPVLGNSYGCGARARPCFNSFGIWHAVVHQVPSYRSTVIGMGVCPRAACYHYSFWLSSVEIHF